MKFYLLGTRRCMGVAWVLIATLALAGAPRPTSAQTVRERENIERLTPEKLELYKAAVKALKDKPTGENYDYFAALHNDFDHYGCEHGSDLFFPWHRALLYKFERALQNADPGGRFKEVTIPYWNWGNKPSGKRYPKAFEDTASPLYNKLRNRSTAQPRYLEAELMKVVVSTSDWNEFAGEPKPEGSFGAFEAPYHNVMHGWIGTPMANPTTAAQDPIFWSFHAYIDLIWSRWQNAHGKDPSSPEADLKALADPATGQILKVQDVRSTEKLGYRYQDTVALLQARTRSVLAQPESIVATSAAPGGVGPFTFDATLPKPGFKTAHIQVTVGLPETLSYSGNVYLYPATEKLRPEDPKFRQAYYVGEVAFWMTAGHAAHANASHSGTSFVAATARLKALAASHAGAQWKIGVVILPAPRLEHENAAANTRTLGEEVQLRDARIVLDHDFSGKRQ